MKSISEINEPEFEAEVLRSEHPVIVNFWASWSQPCRRVGSVLDEFAAECNERVKLVKVNVEDNPDLGMWYGIQSIPTLLYFIDGNVRAKIVGTVSKEAILAKLRSLTGKEKQVSTETKEKGGGYETDRVISRRCIGPDVVGLLSGPSSKTGSQLADTGENRQTAPERAARGGIGQRNGRLAGRPFKSLLPGIRQGDSGRSAGRRLCPKRPGIGVDRSGRLPAGPHGGEGAKRPRSSRVSTRGR